MASNKKKLGTAAAIIAAVAALTAVITHFSGSNPVSGAVKTVFSEKVAGPFRHDIERRRKTRAIIGLNHICHIKILLA